MGKGNGGVGCGRVKGPPGSCSSDGSRAKGACVSDEDAISNSRLHASLSETSSVGSSPCSEMDADPSMLS